MTLLVIFVFLGLVFCAAGMVPLAMPLLTILLSAIAVVDAYWRPARLALSIRIMLILPVLLLFSLLPLPAPLVGASRAELFNRASEAVCTASACWNDTVGQDVRELNSTPPLNTVEAPAQLQSGPPCKVFKRLTLSLSGTVRGFFYITASALIFLLVSRLPLAARQRFLMIIIGLGAAVAVVGIIGKFTSPQGKTLLWLIDIDYGKPMGPFVNRNHFSFFCALLIPPALTLVLDPILAVDSSFGSSRSGAQRVGVFAMRLAAMVCLGCLLSGAVLSLSRGGLLALLAGVGTVALFWVRAKPLLATGAVILAGTVVLTAVFWPSEDVQDRIATLGEATETDSAQTRFQVWGDALSVWRAYPVFGCGTEAFRVVYPQYKSSVSRKGALHCENEYIEILAENGLLGAGLLVAFVGSYLVELLRSLRPLGVPGRRAVETSKKQVRLPPSLTRMSIGVLAVIAVASMVDFGVRIPLNAMLAAALLGLSVPAPAPVSIKEDRSAISVVKPYRPSLIVISYLGTILLICCLLTSRYWHSAWCLDRDKHLWKADNTAVITALSWAPSYWLPWFELGRRGLLEAQEAARDGNEADMVLWRTRGLQWLNQAVQYHCTNYRLWLSLAKTQHSWGNQNEALEAARRGIELRPYKRRELEQLLGRPINAEKE